MYYQYNQNLFEEFQCDDKLCGHIIVEAESCEEANEFMISLGCEFLEDCDYEQSMCRWYRAYSHYSFPSSWENNLIFNDPEELCHFMHKRHKSVNAKMTKPHSRVYYRDGRMVEIGE